MKTALLLSGGMDSSAIAYWKKPDIAITIDYGHIPAPAEERAASAICAALSIKHTIVRADISKLGSGDLAGTSPLAVAPVREWWPFRNQMLITLAAMEAIRFDAGILMIGTLASDHFHSDGCKDFVLKMDEVLKMQEGGMRLEAPAIQFTAAELIRESKIPIELLSWAHSCHRAEFACGTCRGCKKHYETMEQLGYTPY